MSLDLAGTAGFDLHLITRLNQGGRESLQIIEAGFPPVITTWRA